ncbi:putative reverse transcriptase domain-containing protein [Tanacetum coccineum]
MSSDSTSFEVTYTSISSYEDLLAWAVDLFGHQEPDSPEAAPASPDNVPGPEEPKQVPPLSDHVLGPEYPEYLALADDEIIIEDQPYADYASPVALSPVYVTDSDPEEDFKDGPVDYPADGGDDDDDDDSSDDNEVEKEASEEEEEHLALADSVITPVVDLVPSFEETEKFKTDESAATPPPLGARISILPQAPMPFPSKVEVERLLALPIPPSLPRISLSPPFAEEHLARCLAAPALPSSLPIVPYPYSSPNHVHVPPGFRAAIASLFIPPPVDHKEDIPKVELPPHKRLCLTALTSGYEVGESSTADARPTGGHRADYGFIGTLDAETRCQRAKEVGYGIRDVWVDPTEAVEEITSTILKGFNARVIELADVQKEDTQDIYAEIMLLMEQEALVSRESWAQSVGLSSAGQLSVALGQIQALQARDPTHVDDSEAIATNNMPLKRTYVATAWTSAVAWAAIVVAAAPITAADVEKLIEARVSEHLLIKKPFKIALMNFHMKTVTQHVAYAMDWKTLKKTMTVKYCLRELALMCGRMFHEELDEVEKYVGGLPDMIRGNVMPYQPKMMEKAIEFANDQMDQKGHQQQNKRQNTRRAYTAGLGEEREYTGSLPLCTKCNYHHKGPFAPRCNKCKKIGHLARNCRSSGPNGAFQEGLPEVEEWKPW